MEKIGVKMTIKDICSNFNIDGKYVGCSEISTGNINCTYQVKFIRDGEEKQYIVQRINKMVFKLFLPVLLFNNLYTAEVSDAFNPRLMAFAIVSVLITVGLLFLVVPFFEKDKSTVIFSQLLFSM